MVCKFIRCQSSLFTHFLCLVKLFPIQKKKRTVKKAGEEQASSVPRSFVLHRGDVGKSVLQLEMDLRRVMEPYTALNLKVTIF